MGFLGGVPVARPASCKVGALAFSGDRRDLVVAAPRWLPYKFTHRLESLAYQVLSGVVRRVSTNWEGLVGGCQGAGVAEMAAPVGYGLKLWEGPRVSAG